MGEREIAHNRSELAVCYRTGAVRGLVSSVPWNHIGGSRRRVYSKVSWFHADRWPVPPKSTPMSRSDSRRSASP